MIKILSATYKGRVRSSLNQMALTSGRNYFTASASGQTVGAENLDEDSAKMEDKLYL